MQLPSVVPVMILPNVILFPQAMLPLHIFEARYRKMLAEVLGSDRMFCVALRRVGPGRPTPSRVAGLGMVRACVTNGNGTSNLVLQGLARVELGEVVRYRPYRVHHIKALPSLPPSSSTVRALADKVLELVGERLSLGPTYPFSAVVSPASTASTFEGEPVAMQAFRQVVKQLTKLEDPEQLADLISATLLSEPWQRQVILETHDLEGRLLILIRFLAGEIERQKKQKP